MLSIDLVRCDALRRISRSSPEILSRPRHGLAEFASGAQRPIRIAQQFAREEDDIGLAIANDLIRLGRGKNHADRRGRDSRLAPDAPRKRNLVT